EPRNALVDPDLLNRKFGVVARPGHDCEPLLPVRERRVIVADPAEASQLPPGVEPVIIAVLVDPAPVGVAAHSALTVALVFGPRRSSRTLPNDLAVGDDQTVKQHHVA